MIHWSQKVKRLWYQQNKQPWSFIVFVNVAVFVQVRLMWTTCFFEFELHLDTGMEQLTNMLHTGRRNPVLLSSDSRHFHLAACSDPTTKVVTAGCEQRWKGQSNDGFLPQKVNRCHFLKPSRYWEPVPLCPWQCLMSENNVWLGILSC